MGERRMSDDKKCTSAEFVVTLMAEMKAFHENNDRKVALGKAAPNRTQAEWQRAYVEFLQSRWVL